MCRRRDGSNVRRRICQSKTADPSFKATVFYVCVGQTAVVKSEMAGKEGGGARVS